MEKIKVIVLLISASVLVAAVAGIAFAKYVGAQGNPANYSSQTSQGTTGSGYRYPQQGYYPYSGASQYGYPYGYGRGMGMCWRFW